jgi:PBP1b-binding outer membrane lipoprotein LpoB
LFKSIIAAVFLAFLLSACSSSSDTALTQQEEAELRERCKQLLQDAEDLKGRPVRRGAALEYYQNECVLRGEY